MSEGTGMANTAHNDSLSRARLAIGPWTIGVAAREVDGPGGCVRLEPKAMGVLLELAKDPGEVVSRQHLLERVWGPEMATDDVLSRAISELRRALGDDTRNPRFIETVRGAGYRLLVPDTGESSSRQPDAPQLLPTPVRSRRASFVLSAAVAGAVTAALTAGVVLSSVEPERVETTEVRVSPVTTRPGQESAPRLSPDGTRIAYTWRDESQLTQQVYVRLLDGGSELRVTDGVGDYQLSAWSPDGSRLAVSRKDSTSLGIFEVPSLGGGERLITTVSGPYVLGLDWARDGHRLVYAAFDSATTSFGVRVRDLDSHVEQRLTTGARDAFGDVYSTFSPDGRSVAFVRFFSEIAADVYVVSSTGGPPRRLTTDERPIGALAFDRDGRSLLYSANRDGRTAVWRVPVDASDGSSPAKVYESAHGISGLAVYPAQRGMVVAESDQDLNLWTTRVAGSVGRQSSRQFVGSTRADALPRYSPDGMRVAFMSDRSGEPELWVVDTAGGAPVQMTHLGNVRGTPSWSPNGELVAVERGLGDHSELWIVDVARRTAKVVPTGLRDALAPNWAADGKSIYVSSRRDGHWQAFRVRLDRLSTQQLTTGGGMAARPTADGAAIMFVKPYVSGLWRLDLSTGTETLITPEVGAGDCTNWDVGAGGVYLVRRGGDGRQAILYAPFDRRGTTVLVPNVRVPVGSGGISASPDGRYLVYAQTDRRDGDLVSVSLNR
jgi:Tol biopolymer transport system component/DNA-binding winged helix-turn-helix (wHTH) protein